MNKITTIKYGICYEEEFKGIEHWDTLNQIIQEKYGISDKDHIGGYYIKDESKFSMFILKYSHHIEKISYE
jgi:hypothetical protein